MIQLVLVWVAPSAAQCNPIATTTDITGAWGGEHIALTVTDTGSSIEYDCAHGSIAGPIHPGEDGRFAATGVHYREHGGPIREGELPDAHPASYSGRITGDKMSLVVRETDTRNEIGTFTLARGADARVLKCL